MRALVLHREGARLDTRHPEPAETDGDTLVRVTQAGVCQTDLELAKGYMGFAGVLGHEFVGVVEDSPDRRLVGERVVGEINVVCGRCDLCAGGLSSHCRRRSVLGILNHDGCFAEWLRLPAANLHKVPDSIDDDAAVFVEPLAAAVQARQQLGSTLRPRTWVTVIGDGRLGLLVAQVLHDAKAAVRVVGRHEAKLALCERWGIKARLADEVQPRGDQDVVIDCTGSASGLKTALAMCRPRGTLVLKSTYAKPAEIDLSPAVVDEIKVIGSRCGPFKPALQLLAEARVDVHGLISRRMKLDDGPELLRAAGRPGVIKVLVTP
jgi:threonine dehydrogenase-like Zn-dependent dehydrogenase